MLAVLLFVVFFFFAQLGSYCMWSILVQDLSTYSNSQQCLRTVMMAAMTFKTCKRNGYILVEGFLLKRGLFKRKNLLPKSEFFKKEILE